MGLKLIGWLEDGFGTRLQLRVTRALAPDADVAIRMGNLPDSALMARKLGASRRVVVRRGAVPLLEDFNLGDLQEVHGFCIGGC